MLAEDHRPRNRIQEPCQRKLGLRDSQSIRLQQAVPRAFCKKRPQRHQRRGETDIRSKVFGKAILAPTTAGFVENECCTDIWCSAVPSSVRFAAGPSRTSSNKAAARASCVPNSSALLRSTPLARKLWTVTHTRLAGPQPHPCMGTARLCHIQHKLPHRPGALQARLLTNLPGLLGSRSEQSCANVATAPNMRTL